MGVYMSKRIALSYTVILLILSLFLCTSAYSTKSRLSAMGDLSIVIEDESNLINLWDFSGNPAGFLEDEKGSVIRGDFIWDTYQIKGIPYFYRDNWYTPLYKLKANGDIFDYRFCLGLRKEKNYAIGLCGNYFLRQTDSRYDKQESNYPNLQLVFSKSINPQTTMGINLGYWGYTFSFDREPKQSYAPLYNPTDRDTVKTFWVEVGIAKKLISGSAYGITVGYERVKIDVHYRGMSYPFHQDNIYWGPFPYSDNHIIVHTGWISGQMVAVIDQNNKLGMDCSMRFFNNEEESYGSSLRLYLKLHGISDISSRLRLGVFIANTSSYFEQYDPVYTYFSSLRYKSTIFEAGGGLSFRFHQKLLAGLEYHYKDQPQSSPRTYEWDLKIHSLNAGLESEISKSFFLRGGFVGSKIHRKPDYDHRHDTWENIITGGVGYQPTESDFTIELSYRYAFKKYRDWYGKWDVESDARTLSFSFKKGL